MIRVTKWMIVTFEDVEDASDVDSMATELTTNLLSHSETNVPSPLLITDDLP